MADAKLSALTELAATPASDDEVYIRDVSEAAAAESKRIQVSNLMAAAVSGVTREGGNTTEATTTSTSSVDLLTATGMSIGVGSPIRIWVAGRKTAGATAYAGLGLKINATVVGESSTSKAKIIRFGNADEAQSRTSTTWLPHRVSGYVAIGCGVGIASAYAGGAAVTVGTQSTDTAALPLATITDVIIRGISASASITLAADELHVYSFAVS